MNTKTDSLFGIPVTKGKLLSQTDKGFVVSFNLGHLLIQTLLGGQLFNKDKQPLSLLVPPSHLNEIYQYPLVVNSPKLAVTQKESNVIVFVKASTYSADLRIVLWFYRYPRRLENSFDIVDVPEQHIPLLIALTKQKLYKHTGKPVPKELEEEIQKGIEGMQKDGSARNYYIVETFNLSQDDLDKLSEVGIIKRLEWKKSKKDFCHFVNSEYEKNNDDYSSRKEAIRIFFDKYSFKDKKWTVEKCYNLLMQLLRR